MTNQAVNVERATMGELLGLGIQLEAGTQRVYGEFATMFGHCPPVAEFWHLLAMDEALHRSRLTQTRAAMSDERLSQPADARMLREARKLLALDIEERLREVRNLDDAYEMANDLESSETNTIFRFFITEFPRDAKVVAALMRDLDEHVERLITGFPAEYATRTQRAEIKAIRA